MNSFESMCQIANSGLNPIKFGEHYEVDYAPSFEVKGILQDADNYTELIEKLNDDNFDLKSEVNCSLHLYGETAKKQNSDSEKISAPIS